MIRVLTVIGHGIELLPHFIDHYLNHVGANEINIVIYETNLYPTIKKDIEYIVSEYKSDNIKIVKTIYDKVFFWDRITELYNEVKLQKPDDWWIIADIDEFQLYSSSHIDFITKECDNNHWEIVRGGFIDRVAENGEFSKISPNIDIFRQFPYVGFFRYPLSNACPNKICLVKGHIELTSGQHYAIINGETTWRWQGWNHPLIAPIFYACQVHHFKWDSTVIERTKNIIDLNEDYAFSMEYAKLYDELKSMSFKIDLTNKNFMFEKLPVRYYSSYEQWNKLIRKIISI